MIHTLSSRPSADEFAEYYGKYVVLPPEGSIVQILATQLPSTLALLTPLSEEAARHRYAADRWSIKEVIGHLTDTERVMSYRALRIARGDSTPLPGFDQDRFVASGEFDDRPLPHLLAELDSVRRATVLLFDGFSDGTWRRRGTASNQEVTVRALAYIIAGHEIHHREILRSQYLEPLLADDEG